MADLTNERVSLSIRGWAAQGFFKPGTLLWSSAKYRGKQIVLSVQVFDDELFVIQVGDPQRTQLIEASIKLVESACAFGGARRWLECPTSHCRRRVATLYLDACSEWQCRHCMTLAYPCQRESKLDRQIRKAEKIRARLGWMPGIDAGKWGKPHGMHERTFERLESQYDDLIREIRAKFRQMVFRSVR